MVAHSPVQCAQVGQTFSDMSYCSSDSGAGVFAAGSMYWTKGLIRPAEKDTGIDGPAGDFATTVTTNLLRAMAAGPMGREHPARPNLTAPGANASTEVVARCAAEGVPFTVISTTSRRSLRPWRRASIKAMHNAGLTLCLASDDPGMFPTTLAAEYQIAEEQIGLSTAELVEICVNGWRASWLPEAEKQARIDEVRALAGAGSA